MVAEEVRKLVEQSATSSQEIAKLIQEIQAGTEHAVKEMASGASIRQELIKPERIPECPLEISVNR